MQTMINELLEELSDHGLHYLQTMKQIWNEMVYIYIWKIRRWVAIKFNLVDLLSLMNKLIML